jgi:hypothetical protein
VTRQAALIFETAEHILLDYDGKLHLFENIWKTKRQWNKSVFYAKTENPELLRQLGLLEKIFSSTHFVP